MDREAILTILITKSLGVVAWPPLSLLCPLYASIRAMESDSRSDKRRCLAFWTIFSLFKIVEWGLAGLFSWHPRWPHVKGMATILLVFPYFSGASFIYTCFFKQYCIDYICKRSWNIFSQRSTSCILDNNSKLLDISDRTIIKSKLQEEKPVIYQGSYDPGRESKKRNYNKSTGKKKIQKEWSCALCQISTSSENCLGKHLQGKKHKAKEDDLSVELCVTKSTYMLSSTATRKRTKGMVLLENFNQIANLLNPVSRTIRWCGWTKPEFGWTKLNTDGSINKENAGFGGLLRDHKGEPLCAFVSKVPQGDIFLVELWAIWRGLVLALGLGIKVIWVESDSMSVVKTINKEQPPCLRACSCIRYIRKLLSKFEKYQVSHTWRETNRAADHLAKMVLWGNDVVLWPDDFPTSLCNIIKEDAKGKKYPRW
ncbi:putative transcription factor C2H2 family [Senna tora]|uniref:Putative transcription factor C2H2 family n=1 Tax=Senna tora TaxID=362788 RepID=A0A834T859_9FABA|nr:putative transcription factor C2H2 family [Senna tora]